MQQSTDCHLYALTVCRLHVVDEPVKQRDALISEIQLLKQAAEEERDKLTAAHQSELQQLEMELNARNEDALHRCELCQYVVPMTSHCVLTPPLAADVIWYQLALIKYLAYSLGSHCILVVLEIHAYILFWTHWSLTRAKKLTVNLTIILALMLTLYSSLTIMVTLIIDLCDTFASQALNSCTRSSD